MKNRTAFIAAAMLAAAFHLSALSGEVQAGHEFKIAVDQKMWAQWGFRYPVTYIFETTELSADAAVKRLDAPGAGWRILPQKNASDFFNGIECVRADRERKRLFVSVGFETNNAFELAFENGAPVTFLGAARYYDDRQAAYSLSLDNWGRLAGAHPGAPFRTCADDQADKYQAALHVCRGFRLPVSIAINTRMAGGSAMWQAIQSELDLADYSWEPAVHAQTHPASAKDYEKTSYREEIIGCRDELLQRLCRIPFGQHIYEHILTCGFVNDAILDTDAADFLFVRGYNSRDNPSCTSYAAWDPRRRYYGVGGLSAKAYDRVLERRSPKARFCASDVAELNAAFDAVYAAGGICYAMWHPDRYLNSVAYDPRPGVEGVQGSTLMRHLSHVANRKDVWYVANGWLYSYRYVAENAAVTRLRP